MSDVAGRCQKPHVDQSPSTQRINHIITSNQWPGFKGVMTTPIQRTRSKGRAWKDPLMHINTPSQSQLSGVEICFKKIVVIYFKFCFISASVISTIFCTQFSYLIKSCFVYLIILLTAYLLLLIYSLFISIQFS